MRTIKIGENIKKLREQMNLTQDQLGQKVGISGKTICSWEINRTSPKMTSIIALATFFNIDEETLAYGDLDLLDESEQDKVLRKYFNLTLEERNKVCEYVDFLLSQRNK